MQELASFAFLAQASQPMLADQTAVNMLAKRSIEMVNVQTHLLYEEDT